MNFMKKIFEGKKDELTHLQFQKFSKGEFRDRALLEVKKMGKGYSIKTSAEFGNELVRIVAEKLGDEKTNVKGVIVSTLDLDNKISFTKKSNFQGVKKYAIDDDFSGNQLISLLDEMPKNFFGLSFKASKDDCMLKIKAKAPKSGKPGKEGEAKADFCTLKTTDAELAKSFVFEKPDFTKAVINHTYFIDKIVIPEELKASKDFALMREKSLRAGKILRKAIIDDKDMSQEFEFSA